MVNQQEPLGPDRRFDGAVRVHSIFETIQGEGPFVGWPAIFIRLFGCNLQCPGCDTEYTSRDKLAYPAEITQQLAALCTPHKLIVITGGEPFRQNITPLVEALLAAGYKVQIESNGVLYPGDDFPWDRTTVVVSPKTGRIHPKTAMRAHAFKYVLAWDSVAPDGLPETALGHPLAGFGTVARPPKERPEVPVYLNPMDVQHPIGNERNLRAVAASVMEHKTYIMGIQLHKEIGLP